MLADQQLGPQLADAGSKGDTARETALEDEFERRADAEEQQRRGIGVGIPPGAGAAPQGAAGTTAVSPEVALQMLENVSKGEPAFKPALGKGGASWFVTEGAPYTSVDAAKNVLLEVTIDKAGQSSLSTAQLDAMFEVELLKRADIEAAWRARFNHQGATPTSGKLLKSLKQFAKRFAESKMWDRVGEMANAAPAKVLEVSLEDSQFSKSANGKFTVVADGSKIKVKGGVGKLLSVVEGAGLKAEPAVSEAAVLLAQRMAWAGRVRTVLRVGGRVAIIVAVAADVVKIYYAQDRVKATVESLGGWAGATAGAAAFAAWWTPADVAGPWAWVGHGVGTLVSGAVGYWIGESTTRWVYELVAE